MTQHYGTFRIQFHSTGKLLTIEDFGDIPTAMMVWRIARESVIQSNQPQGSVILSYYPTEQYLYDTPIDSITKGLGK